ncbi:MAG: heme lyase CcmF/NrfE family subunit [Gammaproteobacteria bacterium]
MIPEFGHFALALALAAAVVQATIPLIGAHTGRLHWMHIGKPAVRVQCLFVSIAFAALAWAFVTNDFSVAYVAANSNTALPGALRFSALWGAHEGSLLLWVLILSLWSAAVSFYSRDLPPSFVARVIAVLGLISIGFLLFMLYTSNPFERQLPPAANGADLNPLLQDPGLIIHPPMLYVGYVGFSVAFSFAVAGLIGGHLDSAWARWARPWTMLAWAFLTLGIALGSWWAYYELGWGGWWFWDPVENASFMPWLTGTALMHSLAATEKRDVFKSWTVLLAIAAFGLSLLGTFLVRSGVLTSVHAFATDPERGIFILVFLALVIGGALALYAWRGVENFRGNSYELTSRECFLLFNSVLLSVATATVLLGTLYPLFLDALGLGKISVGPPYFNAVFIPLMTPVLVLLALGQASHWKRDRFRRIVRVLRAPALALVVMLIACAATLNAGNKLSALFGLALALWVIAASVSLVVDRCRLRRRPLAALFSLPPAFAGQIIAHIGFAVTVVGVTMVSVYGVDKHLRMGPGDRTLLSGYEFEFVQTRQVDGPNYDGTEILFNVWSEGTLVATLTPQKRRYQIRRQTMTEAGIDAGFTRDVYVSLGEPLEGDDWSVRLNVKPFVRWLWLGALLMGGGALLAACDARFRRRRSRANAVAPENASSA